MFFFCFQSNSFSIPAEYEEGLQNILVCIEVSKNMSSSVECCILEYDQKVYKNSESVCLKKDNLNREKTFMQNVQFYWPEGCLFSMVIFFQLLFFFYSSYLFNTS